MHDEDFPTTFADTIAAGGDSAAIKRDDGKASGTALDVAFSPSSSFLCSPNDFSIRFSSSFLFSSGMPAPAWTSAPFPIISAAASVVSSSPVLPTVVDRIDFFVDARLTEEGSGWKTADMFEDADDWPLVVEHSVLIKLVVVTVDAAAPAAFDIDVADGDDGGETDAVVCCSGMIIGDGPCVGAVLGCFPDNDELLLISFVSLFCVSSPPLALTELLMILLALLLLLLLLVVFLLNVWLLLPSPPRRVASRGPSGEALDMAIIIIDDLCACVTGCGGTA